jgi:arginyl-tRNA synthetase
MHVGHCRGAVFGDALCSLLQFRGYRRHARILHQRRRRQVDVLARSASCVPRGARRDIGEIPEGLYPAYYLVPVGQGAGGRIWRQARKEMPEAAWLPIVAPKAIA